MKLVDIQHRFQMSTETEHWEKLKSLLCSKDEEIVVMGMHLLQSLDADIYLDGLCTLFLWNPDVQKIQFCPSIPINNPKILAQNILELIEREEYQHHPLYSVFLAEGYLDDVVWDVLGVKSSKDSISSLVASCLLRVAKTGVLIKAASQKFRMGVHEGAHWVWKDVYATEVELTRDFWLQKYPVTQQLWNSMMPECQTQTQTQKFLGCRYPIVDITWFEAVVFCNRMSQNENFELVYQIPEDAMHFLSQTKEDGNEEIEKMASQITMNLEANGYRLPFEHEWEYAAKGGQNTIFAGSDDDKEVAWTGETCKNIQPVGMLKPNAFGLFDMSGCVTEYTSTPFTKNFPIDPLTCDPSISSKRTLRGGGWWEFSSSAIVWERDFAKLNSGLFDRGCRLCRFV